MRKILMSAVAAAVLVVLFASAQGTAALWRAEETLKPGTITTGTLSLAVGNGSWASADFPFEALDTQTLGPGRFVQAPLTISNTGTTTLGYSLVGAASATTPQSAADAALAAAVVLSVHVTDDSAACAADASSPDPSLYEGSLAGAAFAEAGDLQPGEGELLCVRVALPANASPDAAGGKLQLVLTWRGDQR
ncbi:hypothetical protein [Arthrobacter sp. N199823]|uniref:hypothetical protein n=1 Tax=Arthrobacter sp. N199823 TaxID=2058895 RepID=UPI000CE327CC|nr:hypothetical protein [Arthrobacter sp. N199823]